MMFQIGEDHPSCAEDSLPQATVEQTAMITKSESVILSTNTVHVNKNGLQEDAMCGAK